MGRYLLVWVLSGGGCGLRENCNSKVDCEFVYVNRKYASKIYVIRSINSIFEKLERQMSDQTRQSDPNVRKRAQVGEGGGSGAGLALLDDRLNRELIDRLQRDGRMAFSEIAQQLGVSEGTVRNRVGAMKSGGALRIVAITDPGVSEYRTEAMIGLKVAPGHRPEDVATRLAQLDEIVYVVWVSGAYDLLIEIVSEDRAGFLSVLSEHVHNSPDIGSSDVMTGLKNFKNQFLLKSNWG
jgi:Lrp/AsnC family transcriptional regulator for asnA, asnC and gidA